MFLLFCVEVDVMEKNGYYALGGKLLLLLLKSLLLMVEVSPGDNFEPARRLDVKKERIQKDWDYEKFKTLKSFAHRQKNM